MESNKVGRDRAASPVHSLRPAREIDVSVIGKFIGQIYRTVSGSKMGKPDKDGEDYDRVGYRKAGQSDDSGIRRLLNSVIFPNFVRNLQGDRPTLKEPGSCKE